GPGGPQCRVPPVAARAPSGCRFRLSTLRSRRARDMNNRPLCGPRVGRSLLKSGLVVALLTGLDALPERLARAASLWNFAGAGSWTTSTNWSPTFVPDSTDHVEINNGGNAQLTAARSANTVSVARGASTAGLLTISAGGVLTSNTAYVGRDSIG